MDTGLIGSVWKFQTVETPQMPGSFQNPGTQMNHRSTNMVQISQLIKNKSYEISHLTEKTEHKIISFLDIYWSVTPNYYVNEFTNTSDAFSKDKRTQLKNYRI
ncbi:unnamed protein product [Trichobilharzia regenti]|nr:unnamed protein product [Trichobilharzia regenti]